MVYGDAQEGAQHENDIKNNWKGNKPAGLLDKEAVLGRGETVNQGQIRIRQCGIQGRLGLECDGTSPGGCLEARLEMQNRNNLIDCTLSTR